MSTDICTPENIAKNPNLSSPCSCLASSNAIIKAVDAYETQIKKYNADYAQSLSEHTKLSSDKTIWDTNKQNKENQLSQEIKSASCGPAGTNQKCDSAFGSGWIKDNHQGCQFNCVNFFGANACTGGYQDNCKRSRDQITADMGPWLSQNPEPPKPHVFTQSFPSAPSGNNVQCCSQIFDNIKGTTVNFDNIKQQCTQEINKQITEAVSAIPVTPPPPITPINNISSLTPAPISSVSTLPTPQPETITLPLPNTSISQNMLLIYGGIGLLLLFFILIIIILIL
jgi:hypothetical protein